MVESFHVHQIKKKIGTWPSLLGKVSSAPASNKHRTTSRWLRCAATKSGCIPPAVATVHLLGRQLRNFAATALRCKVKKRLKWSLVNRLKDYLLYLVDIIWYTIHTIILVNLDIPFINPCSFIYTIHNMIHPWYPYYSYHWASPERDFGWNPQVSFNMKQIPTKSVFYDVLRKRRHRGFNSFKAPGDQ